MDYLLTPLPKYLRLWVCTKCDA